MSAATRHTKPPVAPSGEQFEICRGELRATIVEVGGGIRTLSAGGRELLDSYPPQSICDGAHGTPLIPWPNRLADGRYSFDGRDYQVALTEPDRHNAIHGLLRWRSWRAVERQPEGVVMGTRLHPLAGYPFALDVRIAYALDDDGLTVTTTATNVGAGPCPFGAGQHPYLSPGGGGTIDDCTLRVPAARRILTDAQRSLPCGDEAVAGTELDFRRGVRIGRRELDSAFTELQRDADGRATVVLEAPDGSAVALWLDERYPYVEIYTGDGLAPARRRRGLGVEPMTCAPNAFQSGAGLLRLQPGETFTGRWGVQLA